ncbi:MAG TPA: hypothetical protein VM261_28570 [Kofleriaceae bacterium]|nr:hypothetical protein [Kofleriaceae bacterium]
MTRMKIIATLAGALLSIPAIAWACGGGGDSGGSSSGDSGSSSSSSDSGGSDSSSTAAPACVDTTDVHGYRECSGFGTWRARRAAVAVELGMVSSFIDLSGVNASGTIEHSDGTSYSYKLVGEDFGMASGDLRAANGIALRTLVHGRHVYGGLESSFQFVSGEARTMATTDERAMLTPRLVGVTNALGVVGARRFADQLFGPLAPHGVSAGAELAAGVHMTALEAESHKGVCVTTDRTINVAPVVEARARVDLWFSPHMSLGLWTGADALTRSPSAGILLSSHFRPFDGTR